MSPIPRTTPALLLGALLSGCGPEPERTAGETRRAAGESGTPAEDGAPDLDLLRGLGYVDVGDPLAADEQTGVLVHDPSRAAAGLNLMTSSHECATKLLDMEGRVLRTWSHGPCFRWGNAALGPDGDLVLVGRHPFEPEDADGAVASRYLMRQSWEGAVRWKVQVPVHHDVEWTPDGKVLSMTYDFVPVPGLHGRVPLEDNSLALFSPEGELIEELSVWELLGGLEGGHVTEKLKPRRRDGVDAIDALHLNCVEWMRRPELFGTHAIYDPRHVLICLRHQDLLAIVDWDERETLWTFGPGILSGPHDATLLESGNVLVFDNGLSRGWSRVLEVDPRTGEIVWRYGEEGPDSFYTTTRGANQRLANGNTLITASEEGRVFEVTPGGEVVWEYRNEHLTDDRRPGVIVRMRRLEGVTEPELSARVARGEPLPWVD